jgi:basic membrane protein A and related proteins
MNRIIALLIICLIVCFTQQNQITANSGATKQPLKVGFIMVESVHDWGWNWAHDQGRQYMEKELHGQVQTTFVENVPETAEVERVMEKMIAQGIKLIYATSYGYLEPVLRVAARHPDVIIMHCGRLNPHPMPNVGTYVDSYHNPVYAAGIVAGRVTKKNEIGYVTSHPVPVVIRMLDAFTLGAHSVNPKVKVHVVWTNSWNDPAMEAEAAKGLIDSGVDVLVNHSDSSITAVQVAEKNHIYSIHADIRHLAPKGWLTGPCWDWGPFYVKITKSVIDHTWKPGDRLLSLKDGVDRLSSFGPAVPSAVRKEALDILDKISQGKFVIFKGPIKDRTGKLVIPAGQVADNALLENMSWLVPGIYGNLPKKQ